MLLEENTLLKINTKKQYFYHKSTSMNTTILALKLPPGRLPWSEFSVMNMRILLKDVALLKTTYNIVAHD